MTTDRRDSHAIRYIKKIRRFDPGTIFGFKLFRQHVPRVPALKVIRNSSQWKKVALLRDPIEVYASMLRALETGRWTKKKGIDSSDQEQFLKVHFTPKTFKRFAKRYDGYLRNVLKHADNSDWLVVSYDRLNDLATQQAILDFVGSSTPAEDLTSSYEKQYERPIAEAFDNWDELVEFIAREKPFEGLEWSGRPSRPEFVPVTASEPVAQA